MVVDVELFEWEKLVKIKLKLMYLQIFIFCTFLSDYPEVNLL